MQSSEAVQVAPEQLRSHTQFWLGFTTFMKIGIIAVVALLVIMAATLV